jgi:tRNA pseudouridine synthase 10
MDLGEKAAKLLELENICTRCIGRQFAKLGKMDNFERGLIVKKYKGELKEKHFLEGWKGKLPKEDFSGCDYCQGLFEKVDYYADLVVKALEKYEYQTFLIGCILKAEIIKKEIELWELVGIEYTETIKGEFNRLVGKNVVKNTGKEVDFKRPDILVVVNDIFGAVELNVNSIFIYGKYNKYVRGIPQTKWPCRECRGRGCKRCDFKGKMYENSVEELIGKFFIEKTKGMGTKFHGAGREDIDARCFGKREFIIEILEPVIRKIDLKKTEEEINKANKGLIEVFGLRFAEKNEVERVKSNKADKTYRALVEFEKPLDEKLLAKLKSLENKTILQETPQRVEHRRSKKLRRKKVKKISWKKVGERELEIFVRAESGLYIKELISGDNGKTRPSISEILENRGFCKELDIIEIHYEK